MGGSLGQGEWRGKINEVNTPIDIMYICENTNANFNTLYGEGGNGEEDGESPPSACVHVCHYYYQLHYDVRL